MPIRGLTDRPASFPEIGSVRKGAPKEPNRPGADLKYFRVEFDEREQAAAKIFSVSYPAQPTELNIWFPFNDIDRNFDAWREAYVAGALIHRCDGERVLYALNPQTGERLVVDGKPETPCDRKSGCRPTGRMKVMITELQRLAYLVVHTTSLHDILNLSRQLNALAGINGGRLAGIPLKLKRRPVDISTPSGENGKRARRSKWLLSVEADPEWVAAKMNEMRRLATPEGIELPALEPPAVIESESEPEEIEEGEYTEPSTETIAPLPNLTWDEAVSETKKIGLTVADIVATMKQDGNKPPYNPVRDSATARRLLAQNQPQPA